MCVRIISLCLGLISMCLHQVITCPCWHQHMLSNCCNCCGCLPGCVCHVVNLFTSPPASLPVRRNPMTASLSPLAPSFYMHWAQSQPGLQVSQWLHPLPPPVHLPSHPHTASLSLPSHQALHSSTHTPSIWSSFFLCLFHLPGASCHSMFVRNLLFFFKMSLQYFSRLVVNMTS